MSAAIDPFATNISAPRHGYTNAAAITPSDTVDLTNVTQAIYVGGTGALVVIMQGGQTVTLSAVPVGTVLEVRVSRVKATGTTATLLTALW